MRSGVSITISYRRRGARIVWPRWPSVRAPAGAGVVRVVRADLAQHETPAGLHQQLTTDGVQVDYLVNNAGFGTSGRFNLLPLERELEEIDLNVTALVALTRLLPPGDGRAAARHRHQRRLDRGLSAHAVHGDVRRDQGLRAELQRGGGGANCRGTGVTVMALCPGPVRTEFQKVAGAERMRFPDFMWTQAEKVVNEGIAAAASGRSLCVAGAINNAMVIASKFTPRNLTTFISGTLMRPSSTDK